MWNEPTLMQQRAADADAEAEAERIWEEARIGLRELPEAETDEPEIEPTV